MQQMTFGLTRRRRAYARNTDPRTSHEAAESMAKTLPHLEAIVHKIIKDSPAGMTIDEITALTGLDKVTISPRIAPLARKGLIYTTGNKRAGRSGRAGLIWLSAR